MNLATNPAVRTVSDRKESFWFNGDRFIVPTCSNPLDPYLAMANRQRTAAGRPVLVGDWTATHLSCPCCPEVLRRLNPDLKVIVMLRDPIDRARSRFIEQIRMQRPLPGHGNSTQVSFPAYVARQLPVIEYCLQRAEPYAPDTPLGLMLRMQCHMWDHVLGYSVYDAFLANYFSYFPDKQILVSYMEELAREPMAVLRRIEAHIGAPPHEYDASRVSTIYNSRICYGWSCAGPSRSNASASGPSATAPGSASNTTAADAAGAAGTAATASGQASTDTAATASAQGAAGQGQSQAQAQGQAQAQAQGQAQAQAQAQGAPASDRGLLVGVGAEVEGTGAAMDAAIQRLRAFYRPSMQQLFAWADQGRIAQVPPAWRAAYA